MKNKKVLKKMKKYILYDDKVYELKKTKEDKKDSVLIYYYIETSPNTALLLGKKDLKQYRQADSIEELCDEFIFEGVDDEKPSLCDNFSELLYWFNYSKKQQYVKRNCYGATWTDKGLIYIAKMNDKGELELI